MRLIRFHFSFRAVRWLTAMLYAVLSPFAGTSRQYRRLLLCVICLGASVQVQAAPVQLSATFPASTSNPALASAGVDSIFTTSDGRVWQVVSGAISAGPLTQSVWLYDNGTSLMVVTVLNGLVATVEDISGSSTPADTQLPTVPTKLSATAPSYTAINLAWTAATDNVAVTAYRVYRNDVWIGSVATTSYADSNLTPSTGYSYTVAACDAAGNCSPQSGSVLGTTQAPDILAPSVPNNLKAAATSTSAVNLTWSASTDNVSVTGYKVYRDGAWIGSPTTVGYSDTGLSASTTYSYTVVACDAASNCSARQPNPELATTPAAADLTAPSKPTGLESASIGTTAITLAWSASTDSVGVASYVVYRDGVRIGSTTIPSYADTGLTPATSYDYAVAACDAAGNCSGQGAVAALSTLKEPDAIAPTAPLILVAEAVSPTQVNVSWTMATDNLAVLTYRVFRSSGNLAGQTTAAVTTFSDSQVVSGVTYYYTVAACDAAGNCNDSLTSAVTPSSDSLAPAVPFVLTATATSTTEVELAWQPAVDDVGVTRYKIYRNGQLVATPGSTGYKDAGLIPSASYSYSLAACDAAGHCSLQSSPVSAITLPSLIPISSSADCLFNWAEKNYASWFAPKAQSRADGPNYWRSYPETSAYLWVNSGKLYYYGPLSSYASVDLGATSTWYATAGCQ